MAKFKALTLGGDIVVKVYEFHEEDLSDGSLKVKRFNEYSRDWALFVLENRKNFSRKQIHDYDVVYGPIADDRVGAQIRRLENKDIDLEEFLRRVQYMKGITFQYFFGTEKAIKMLQHL